MKKEIPFSDQITKVNTQNDIQNQEDYNDIPRFF
jgi:hypothetical protein